MQEGWQNRVAGIDRRVVEMIGEAVLAAGYRVLMQEHPQGAEAWGRLAARHSARVAALADEICSGVHRIGAAPEAQ